MQAAFSLRLATAPDRAPSNKTLFLAWKGVFPFQGCTPVTPYLGTFTMSEKSYLSLEPMVRRSCMLGFDACCPSGPVSPFVIRSVGQHAHVTCLQSGHEVMIAVEDVMDIKRMHDTTQAHLARLVPEQHQRLVVAGAIESLALGAQVLQTQLNALSDRVDAAQTFWCEVHQHSDKVGSIGREYGDSTVYQIMCLYNAILNPDVTAPLADNQPGLIKLIKRLPSANRWLHLFTSSSTQAAPCQVDTEPMTYINHYRCPCGSEWTDSWTCACNDRCPVCNTEVEPHHSEAEAAVVNNTDTEANLLAA